MAGNEFVQPLPLDAPFVDVAEQIEAYAIFMVTPDGRIASWNQGVGEILGYGRDDWIGRLGSIIFTPEEIANGEAQKELDQSAATGQAQDNRWQVRKNGERFWANGVMTALRASDGMLLGHIKILRDNTHEKVADDALKQANNRLDEANRGLERRVTERTQELAAMVQQLQRSEGRLAEIFRAGPFAASINSLDDEVFLDVNETFLRVTGYERDEVIGRSAKELGMWWSPEDQESIRREQDEEGEFRDVALTIHTKSGEARDILASSVTLDSDGRKFQLKMFTTSQIASVTKRNSCRPSRRS